MIVTRLKLTNWRNFREVDIPLRNITYLLGPNASGKSNLLDVFRFLRDVSKPKGGGLQKAIEDRGGISKLRCLHARRETEVRIEIHLSDSPDTAEPDWIYILGFKPEVRGTHRTLISTEVVYKKGKKKPVLIRPQPEDEADQERLTVTHLEQIQANHAFREIADFFSETTYLHLVPQLLKYSDRIGGRAIEGDPFGQGFLERIANTSDSKRNSRLKKIEKALKSAIPQFEELNFKPDKSGHPHLEMRYIHHRPHAGLQREEQFSDGTLRLIGLFWSLLESNVLLLLEEPEISLDEAIVEKIPFMLQRIQRDSKRSQQIIISTHSEALLRNKGIDGRGVLRLEPGNDGTEILETNNAEAKLLKKGFSVAEIILPKVKPKNTEQLSLW